jgi:hypothetical protein
MGKEEGKVSVSVEVLFLPVAVINLGRIAALMAYCYQLCKTYIRRKMASTGLIVSFMGLVSGWLFKFFLKAKFYEWLQNQGGWVSCVMGGGWVGWV